MKRFRGIDLASPVLDPAVRRPVGFRPTDATRSRGRRPGDPVAFGVRLGPEA